MPPLPPPPVWTGAKTWQRSDEEDEELPTSGAERNDGSKENTKDYTKGKKKYRIKRITLTFKPLMG